MDERIRLSSTDSANSVDVNKYIDIDMERHTKVFPFLSINDTIDQMEIFENERANSTKYRLILTVNPYCSNVLFNTVTEIVKNEGTDNKDDLEIVTSDGIYNGNGTKISTLTNIDMIRNTMYSNNKNGGYYYHCGYDIFNNHILRNQTFKVVNPLSDENSFKYKNTSGNKRNEVIKNFNTIRDIMRYNDGTEIKLTKRTNIGSIEGGFGTNNRDNIARHLYLKDDVLSFDESVLSNLGEQNGWFGFNNQSSIKGCEFVRDSVDRNKGEWDDMLISKVFNGTYFDGSKEQEHVACEFVEMYPDSSLFSFTPKYNALQHREEQNWDICITYPFENDNGNDKVLINDGNGINALLLATFKETKGTSGQDVLLFRSYVKHNLHIGDKIKLYFSQTMNGSFTEIDTKLFTVVNVGNLKSEHLEYYFYINNVSDVKEVLGINNDEKIPNDIFNRYYFRFAKVVNNRNCLYYYRKFRKLPNLKFKKEELTDDIVHGDFENYINNNCRKDFNVNNEMLPFSKEQYPLAFSTTIYGDNKTQIVFTDTIDIDKFVDNLGRPLTQLYVTLIKRNKGHNAWYNKRKNDLKNIEFSHCFGKVTSGLDIFNEWDDEDEVIQNRKEISDCCLITNTDGILLDDDIVMESNEHDIFYGDIVEFDTYNALETTLSDVHFRFNTEQREHIFTTSDSELKCNTSVIDEIELDDYDYKGQFISDTFTCSEETLDSTYRKEGYHYKAHYPIDVREFGSLRQGSHRDIRITSCRPRQANGLFIEVVSAIRTGVSSGDIVFLCNEDETEMCPLVVNSVQSNVRFLLNPPNPSSGGKNIFELVEGLLHSDEKIITQEDIINVYTWTDENGISHVAHNEITNVNNEIVIPTDVGRHIIDYSRPKYTLRVRNKEIPSYANKVSTNLYLWRDILNVGNKNVVGLKEYPFANGHFYINKEINFFLERQDPFGYGGLYNIQDLPNNVFGNIKKTSNYEYKDEQNKVC